MSRSGDETNTTSSSLDQFHPGEYTVNIAVFGDKTVRGQQEVFALDNFVITLYDSSNDDSTKKSNSGIDTSSTEDETSSETETTNDDTDEVETTELDNSGVSDTNSDDNVIESTDDDSSEDSDDQVSVTSVQCVLLFSILVGGIHHLRQLITYD